MQSEHEEKSRYESPMIFWVQKIHCVCHMWPLMVALELEQLEQLIWLDIQDK